MSDLRALGMFLVAPALLVAASTAPAFAQAQHESGLRFVMPDGSAAAQMPCKDTIDAAPAGKGLTGAICVVDKLMYVFAVAEGDIAKDNDPFASDFDAVLTSVRDSHDTASFSEESFGGLRAVEAGQGPDPKFGLMKAVEIAPDKVVYIVAMADEAKFGAVSAEDKVLAAEFIASLEVLD